MVDIKQFDIATAVTDSVIELFDSMLSLELALSEDENEPVIENGRITGSVRLAGRVMGIINIQVSEEFSKQITAAMLGMEIDEIEDDEEVKDVISEVCNIVGGNLKSKFCDAGYNCELSPPSFTRGNDFKIESLNTARHEHHAFVCGEHPVIIDVGVRENPDAETEAEKKLAQGKALKPIDPEAFNAFDVRTPVIDSMVEVFDMMLSMEIEASDADVVEAFEGERIVGGISYVGPVMGTLNIYVKYGFAFQMAAAMLGVEPDELEGEDEVKDVVSEICNIVGGNLKSKFTDSEMFTRLSTPSYTTGSDFIIESMNMTHYEKLAFRYGDEVVYLEVGAKMAEVSQSGDNAGASILDELPDALDPQVAIDEILKAEKEAEAKRSEQGDQPEPEPVPVEEPAAAAPIGEDGLLDYLLDVPVAITVELGRTRKKLSELFEIGDGSVIELTKLSQEPVDIRVNDTLIARGEIVVDNEKYGVRILETMSRMKRIQSLTD